MERKDKDSPARTSMNFTSYTNMKLQEEMVCQMT